MYQKKLMNVVTSKPKAKINQTLVNYFVGKYNNIKSKTQAHSNLLHKHIYQW